MPATAPLPSRTARTVPCRSVTSQLSLRLRSDFGGGLRAFGPQVLRHLRLTLRVVERRLSVPHAVDRRPVLDEQLHDLQVPTPCGTCQRETPSAPLENGAVLENLVDPRPALQQPADDLRVALEEAR